MSNQRSTNSPPVEPALIADSNGSMEAMEEAYDLLANPRRRAIIKYLYFHDHAVDRKELVKIIAAQENNVAIDEVSCHQRKIVHNALMQRQFPRLKERDAIDYDKNSHKIRPTQKTEEVARYLRVRSASNHSWEIYYWLVGVFCIFLLFNSLYRLLGNIELTVMESNIITIFLFTTLSISYMINQRKKYQW